jgi:hypothetical protein
VTSADGGRVCDTEKTAKLIISPNGAADALAIEDAKPTAVEIEQWFRKIHSDAKAAGGRAGQRLYLYFAGHGFEARPNSVEVSSSEPAIIMANAERDALEHIPPRSWADIFYAAGYFDEVLLFMDCCRETQTDWPLNTPQIRAGIVPDDDRKRFYAFATKFSKLARERVFDADNKSHGVFTFALMQALGGAAADATGQITAATVRDWLFNNLHTLIGDDSEASKRPDIPFPVDPERDIVIVKGKPPPPFEVTIRVPGVADGTPVVIKDHMLAVVAEQPLAGEACSFELPVGKSFVYMAACGDREEAFQVPRPGGKPVELT